jgi:hypothetical protein
MPQLRGRRGSWAGRAAVAGLLPAGALAAVAASPADRVFVNAVVWTGDEARPRAQALAVKGDRLVAVGTSAEALKHRGPATEVVDLEGRLVAPGFIDAHLHLLALERVELDEAADLAEVQGRLRTWAAEHPDEPWIVGRGWAYAMFPGGEPHRRHLDAVGGSRPALVHDRDGHAALASTRALELAGVDGRTPDPPGGVIVRDPASREPTGLLKEAATRLVSRLVPAPSPDELYRTLRKRLDQAAAFGLTSVHNASAIELEVYERVLRERGLKVRVYACLPFRKDLPAAEWRRYRALRAKHRGPLLRFGAVKGVLDGTIDSKTAAMTEPYVGGGEGLPLWTQDDLDRTARAFDREGFQILLHAVGDRAIHMALDAYEKAARANRTRGRRHRVEHAEVPLLSDLPRFKALGVVASTQALFANPDRNVLENFQVVLGPERAARADAFRLFDEAGAVQAFGSDWPVFSMDALKGMYAAVTRTTPQGSPSGGWFPENRIAVEAALRHFTSDAAWAGLDEQRVGRLTPGRLADFVVLSEDVLAGPPERLLTAQVVRTVMGGKDTFRRP